MLKFYTYVRSGKVPIYLGLPVIPIAIPRGDVALHSYQIGNSSIQALPIQGATLDLCHIEPTAVFWRVMDFEASLPWLRKYPPQTGQVPADSHQPGVKHVRKEIVSRWFWPSSSRLQDSLVPIQLMSHDTWLHGKTLLWDLP